MSDGMAESDRHDLLCGCERREHHCENSWAGTHCTRCECSTIRRARADEREQIAQAIEALPAAYIAAGVWEDPGADHDHDGWDGEPVIIRSEAARLARNGGRDE